MSPRLVVRLPRRCRHAHQSRGDPPGPPRSGTRWAHARAGVLPADRAGAAQASRALAQQAPGSRHRRRRPHPAAGRGHRPRGPRALGRRPEHRAEPAAIGTVVERASRYAPLVHLPRLPGHGLVPPVKNGPALGGYGTITMKDTLTTTMGTMPTDPLRPPTGTAAKSCHDQDVVGVARVGEAGVRQQERRCPAPVAPRRRLRQGAGTVASADCRNQSRTTRFSSLPVAPRGSSSTNTIRLGTSKVASLSRQNVISSTSETSP